MLLRLTGIKKHYSDFDIDLSFDAEHGQILTLLGPSGCGKTTTLHIIAGFIEPDRGKILLDNREITQIPPHRRNVGLVFQDYALFPHMNVFGNISFGLRMQRWGNIEINKRVKDLLHLIQLEGYEKRIVTDLSGGEQQRVALARALAPNPDILLLDEPLSALDARLRKDLRKQIRRIQRELHLTTVYVTHDQEEALAISDKIVIMNNGRVEQTGTTLDIYHRPKTKFVANFVGITNFIQARVTKKDGEYIELESPEGTLFIHYSREISIGADTLLLIRPEKCTLVHDRKNKNTVTGIIEDCEFLGDCTVLTVKLKKSTLTARLSDSSVCRIGDEIMISFSPEDCWILEDK